LLTAQTVTLRQYRSRSLTGVRHAAAVGTLAGVTRLTGREVPDGLAPGDVLLAAVATHKLSRLDHQ
jgi:hypothetical protein